MNSGKNQWKQFKKNTYKEEMLQMEHPEAGHKPAFEDTMVLDTNKAMRRDRN